jgi:hypothetical protein
MSISVVIPAFNAAATLGDTLDSLLAQTSGAWEAIVVDDGSTDATGEIAARCAERDTRIRVVRQANAGMAAARNAGIRLARHEWLQFLDADDWLGTDAVAAFLDAAARDPEAGAICGRWARVASTGETFADPFVPDASDLFPIVACFCPFAIHSCVVRRRVIEEVGGFDASLRICADWDLWQRVARIGTRFAATDAVVALYRMRAGSAALDARRLADEGLRLVALGHGPDPRVQRADPRYARGMAVHGLANARLRFLCWPAGMLLGSGQDGRPLLDSLTPEDRDLELEPAAVAHSIFRAALLPRAVAPRDWNAHWADISGRIDEFLVALEARAAAPRLAHRARTELERLILRHSAALPVIVGTRLAVRIECTAPLADLAIPPRVDRVICFLTLEGESIGEVELPACGPRLPADVVADAIVADHAWPIIGRFFRHHIYPQLRFEAGPSGTRAYRDTLLLSDTLPGSIAPASGALHDAVGWTVFLQELWGERAPADWFYDQGARQADGPREPLPASDAVTVEVSAALPTFTAAGSVSVEFTVGGVPVHLIAFEPIKGHVSAQRLRAVLTQEAGFELARAAAREALVGTSLLDPTTLRDRLVREGARRAHRANAEPAMHVANVAEPVLAPSWRTVAASAGSVNVIGRRRLGATGTSASRRAILPAAAIAELEESATAAGEPWVHVADRDDAAVRYAPEVLWQTGQNGYARARRAETATARRLAAATHRLPILLYHRIARGQAGPLARYRIEPDVFEAQIRYLRETGFRSATLEEWRQAMRAYEPLPGRRIILTFDDGYADFAESAWPILRQNGFGALVFVVTDRVGGTSEWTTPYGEATPLLGWDEIRHLREQGVEFGSHTATHPHLTVLAPADVVREAARSRTALTRALGAPPSAIAYPHLAGACGYFFGLSCRPGPCRFTDPLLALPRIEICAEDGLTGFVRKLSA